MKVTIDGRTAILSNSVTGLSAYEIALKNGFVGTEAEWLESLSNHEEYLELKEEVDLNTAKIGITPQQANDILVNNTKNSYPDPVKLKEDIGALGVDAGTVNGKTVEVNVPNDAVFTDTVFSADYNDLFNTPNIPINNNQLINGAGYITSETSHPADALTSQNIIDIGNLSGINTGDQDKANIDALGINAATVNDKTVETSVPAGAMFTDTVYDDNDVLKNSDTLSPVTTDNKILTENDQTSGPNQSTDFIQSDTLNIDLSLGNNINVSGEGQLNFSNLINGQSGNIVLNSTGTITKSPLVKTDNNFLSTISASGTYWLNYLVSISDSQLNFNSANQVKDIGAETSAERIVYCDNGNYICGSEGNAKIYTSSDYGATWVDRGALGSGATVVFGLGYLENGIALAGTSPNGDLFRTTDYGATWSLVSYGKTTNANDLRGIAYVGNGVVCIGNAQINSDDLTDGSMFYRSTNYGANWDQVFHSTDTEGMFGCYTMSYVGNNNLIASIGNGGSGGPYTDQSHIIHSSDGGVTWTTVLTNIDSYAAYCSSGDDSGTCYIPFSGGSYDSDVDSNLIFESTDYGVTWTRLPRFFTDSDGLNGLTYLGDGRWLIGTDDNNGTYGCGVYLSTDGCETWTKEYDLAGADNDYRVYAIATDEDKNLVFGTFHFSGTGKIWQASYTSSGGANVFVTTSNKLS